MITQDQIQEVAGDLERLLLEKKDQINFAYARIDEGFKISIGIEIEHTSPPTVNYSISFPMEPPHDPVLKETSKLRKVIGQPELELEEKK